MPTRVVFALMATLALVLSVVFRVWGQEEELRGLDVKAVSLCRTGLDNARAPCIILSSHEDASVIYVAVFTVDGTEVQTIVRHDNALYQRVQFEPCISLAGDVSDELHSLVDLRHSPS